MNEYCATRTDDNPHQAETEDNQHQAGRPRSYCDFVSNIKFLRTVIIVLSVLLIILLIVIGVITSKNDTYITKPNDNNFQQKPDFERITPPNNDPFCLFPVPRTNVNFMKCFLPYKGEYIVDCVFDLPAKVTRICAMNDTTYHYKLDCASNSSFGYNCNQVCSENCAFDCKDDCTQFSITVRKSGILLLEMGDNCLQNDGYIEIWNATIHRRVKRKGKVRIKGTGNKKK